MTRWFVIGLLALLFAHDSSAAGVKNVVLVHGAFADGSGWMKLYSILKKDGYNVAVVQNPTESLADDIAVTKRAMAAMQGPVILVGHSYGGVVITEAGTDSNVAALVYVAAWVPDKGESVISLLKSLPAGATPPPFLPPQDGYLTVDPAKFPAAFAADVDKKTAQFMADSQPGWGEAAQSGAVTEPAWKSKPSWYLLTTEDRMIPPDLQRMMSKRAGSKVIEVKGSHAFFVAKPEQVAKAIEAAAKGK